MEICTTTWLTNIIIYKVLKTDNHSSQPLNTSTLKVLITSDVRQISRFINTFFVCGVPVLINILIMAPFLWLKMKWPGLIALMISFLTVPFTFYMQKLISNYEERRKEKEDHLTSVTGEWVSNFRLVRYLGWNPFFRDKIKKALRQFSIVFIKQEILEGAVWGLTYAWWLIPIIVMLITSKYLNFHYAFEAVFAAFWMLNYIQSYIQRIPSMLVQYGFASPCIARIKMLWQHPEIKDKWLPSYFASQIKIKPVRLIFKNVVFRYLGKNPFFIKNLNLTLNLNQSTGIIGKVGSGKTTILKLICGEFKPESGRILIEFEDGTQTDLWHEDIYRYFRSFIGYVPQESYLSNSSFDQNISLDDCPESSRIMNSIYLSELEADLNLFEKGVKEEIGEHGINLSGGQKRRIDIARFFYSERQFGVFDDPLSAVDPDTESSLIQHILTKCTDFVMTSHRLNELNQFDRIITLEDGNIVEDDHPDILLNNSKSKFYQFLNRKEDQTH